ncbi:MAG: tetratricopeptide repeat protein [Nitrospina sp.]|jgi:tetratricopeptide (TPR) repeat protein|nr:tetratricopeptide repeat protein [Nitrospina sp.]MBT5633473.1 tetratricopeptide repeat protein [Nitrospina sp.]
MTKTKLIALFVAIVGSLLFFYNYFNTPETWEDHNKKGVSAFHDSHYEQAENHFMRALELIGTFSPKDPRHVFILYQLAEVYRIQSKLVQAEKILKQILSVEEAKFGSTHPNVALGLNNLAGNYRERGKYKEAETLLQQALSILEDTLGKESSLVGNILEHYAHLLHAMDRHIEAEKLESRYRAIYSKQVNDNK